MQRMVKYVGKHRIRSESAYKQEPCVESVQIGISGDEAKLTIESIMGGDIAPDEFVTMAFRGALALGTMRRHNPDSMIGVFAPAEGEGDGTLLLWRNGEETTTPLVKHSVRLLDEGVTYPADRSPVPPSS